jgi:hypothetical protein
VMGVCTHINHALRSYEPDISAQAARSRNKFTEGVRTRRGWWDRGCDKDGRGLERGTDGREDRRVDGRAHLVRIVDLTVQHV